MMNKQFLLTFLDVMETRNFNRTADRLNITQSTVSARIRELEEELNTALFERGRGGAEPTQAGLRFQAYCCSALALWTQARRDLGLNKEYRGELNISAELCLISHRLLEWAELMRQSNPDVSLYFEANSSLQIQRDILAGKTDIGVIFAPQYLPDLQVSEIGQEAYVMLSTDASTLSEIDLKYYIKVHYTPHFERYHDEHLPHLSRPPLSAGSDDLAIEFLKRFGGTVYLPNFAVRFARKSLPTLRFVEGAPIVPQPIYSVVHVRRCHNPLIANALRTLREHTGDSAQSENSIEDRETQHSARIASR